MNVDGQVITYLALAGVLLVIVILLRFKNGIVFRTLFRIAIGGGVILLFNYIITFFHISGKLPFNIFSVLAAAFLEVPGFILLIIIKYIIYP